LILTSVARYSEEIDCRRPSADEIGIPIDRQEEFALNGDGYVRLPGFHSVHPNSAVSMDERHFPPQWMTQRRK